MNNVTIDQFKMGGKVFAIVAKCIGHLVVLYLLCAYMAFGFDYRSLKVGQYLATLRLKGCLGTQARRLPNFE